MIDIVEILIHWYAGRSQHELAASLGGGSQDAAQVPGSGAGGRDRAVLCFHPDPETCYELGWMLGARAWYVDGAKCQEFRDPGVADHPMQIILNLTVDVDWQRAVGSTLTDESQTRELEVDYLRIYQAGATNDVALSVSTLAGE